MTQSRIRAAARSLRFFVAAFLTCACLSGGGRAARAEGEAVEVELVDARALAAPLDSVRAEAPPANDSSAFPAFAVEQGGGDLLLPSPDGQALRNAIGGFSAVQAHALRAGAASLASRSAQPRPNGGLAGLPAGLSRAEQEWLEKYYLPLPAPGAPYGVYASAAEQAEADSLFALVNQFRVRKGAGMLRRDAHLDAVAQAHALHMARAGFFDHRDPLGMEVYERINAAGAPGWRAAGENIAAGQRSAREVHETWLGSKGHRRNVLSEQYECIGIGAAYLPGTEFGWFWVQVFATFDGHTASSWIEPLGSSSAAAQGSAASRASRPVLRLQQQRYSPRPLESDSEGDNAPCLTGG